MDSNFLEEELQTDRTAGDIRLRTPFLGPTNFPQLVQRLLNGVTIFLYIYIYIYIWRNCVSQQWRRNDIKMFTHNTIRATMVGLICREMRLNGGNEPCRWRIEERWDQQWKQQRKLWSAIDGGCWRTLNGEIGRREQRNRWSQRWLRPAWFDFGVSEFGLDSGG